MHPGVRELAADARGPSPTAFESASAGTDIFGELQSQGGGLGGPGEGGFTTMDIIVATGSNYGGGVVWAQYAVSDAFRERIAGERLGRAGYAYVTDRRGFPLEYPKRLS